MTIELTVEEKTTIVGQHLKTVAYAEYNAMLSLAQAQAVTNPNADNIESLTNQLSDASAQRSVLEEELNSLK